jgi:hypothetical protein
MSALLTKSLKFDLMIYTEEINDIFSVILCVIENCTYT